MCVCDGNLSLAAWPSGAKDSPALEAIAGVDVMECSRAALSFFGALLN